jgi:stress-induced-phosphoprotein 1
MAAEGAEQKKNWKDEGNAAFKLGKWGLAIKCYTSGIREDPNNHLLYSNRCAAWLKMSKDHKALEDAEKCIQLQPLWAKVPPRLPRLITIIAALRLRQAGRPASGLLQTRLRAARAAAR